MTAARSVVWVRHSARAVVSLCALLSLGAQTRDGSVASVTRLETPNIGVPMRAVVTSPASWARVWSFAAEAEASGPSVDLSSNIAIVVAAGRLVSGSTMTVDDPVIRSEAVVIRVRQTSPGSGCEPRSAVIAPTVVLLVPHAALPSGELRVRYDESTAVVACD